jgi:hypothetical protein
MPYEYPESVQREIHPAGPKTAIINSGEFYEQHTMRADYFVNRLDGETLEQFSVRREIEDLEHKAQLHDQTAAKMRERIAQLREATP